MGDDLELGVNESPFTEHSGQLSGVG